MKRVLFWVTEMLIVFVTICASSFLISAVVSLITKFFEVL